MGHPTQKRLPVNPSPVFNRRLEVTISYSLGIRRLR
jgi:hypothetical protein